MKSLLVLLKEGVKMWLPLLVLNGLIVLVVLLFNKYWFLQPLWQVYSLVILFQLSVWIFILYVNKASLIAVKDKISFPQKVAFVIGLAWSIIQIFWLQQWWTWLNLISQPFVYVFFSIILINIFNFTIDQINKIRHHDVG